jgi:MFS family permease
MAAGATRTTARSHGERRPGRAGLVAELCLRLGVERRGDGVKMTNKQPISEGIDAYPPAYQAWTSCIILFLGCALAFMDRNIINLFIIPIQRDLKLSDTEISLLVGFAFGVFNALFGLPVARWVDRGRRRTIAAIGVAVWSVANVGCGFSMNFGQLFLGRVAVGAGEAAVTPAGVSLLADLFPPHRRGAAMGLFYAGTFVGGGGALIIGGLLWRALGDRSMEVPLLGHLHSWQLILMMVGAIGVIVAPLTMLIREPPRLDSGHIAASAGVPIAHVVSYYKKHSRTLAGHNVGFCLQNFALHAGAAWLPTLLVRTEGWSIAQAGATYGGMMLVLGPIGTAAAGGLADAISRTGRSDGKLLVAIVAAAICGLASLAIACNASPGPILAAIALFSFFGTFSLPLAPGALQEIMPNAMRGQATAVYVGVTNLVAGGLAATAVAVLTDFVFHDRKLLHVSFGVVGAVVCTLAALTLTTTLRAFRATATALAEPGPGAAAFAPIAAVSPIVPSHKGAA